MAQARTRTQIVIQEHEPDTVPALEALPIPQKSGVGRKFLLYVAALAVLLALGAFLLFRTHRPATLGEKNSILVADFANTTGDPVFDDTLRQGLSVELEQTPFLQFVSDDQIGKTLRLMEKPPDTRLTPGVAREACRRANAATEIEGSIATLGNQYVIGLSAVDCQSGDTLAQEQASANGKERVLIALGDAASKLRVKLGEPRASLEKHGTAGRATTPSLEALKAYSMGWKVAASQGGEPAIPFFRRAVEIDPSFAVAYATLGLMYGSTGSSQLATENVTRAYEIRDRASDKERFFITGYYFGRATGNQEKAQQVCDEWARTYPREVFFPIPFLLGLLTLYSPTSKGPWKRRKRSSSSTPTPALDTIFSATT